MFKWLTSQIRRIVGRLLMKAAYWTTIGAILVPIGVLLAVEVPNWSSLAFWIIIAGLVSIIAGWTYTVREERQRRAEADKEEHRRRTEAKQRNRESRAFLLVLSEIAKRQGVSMVRVTKTLKRWADEEKADGEETTDDL